MSEIKKFTTKELVEELRNREGVETVNINVGEEYFIDSINDVERDSIEDTGPAIILIVTN